MINDDVRLGDEDVHSLLQVHHHALRTKSGIYHPLGRRLLFEREGPVDEKLGANSERFRCASSKRAKYVLLANAESRLKRPTAGFITLLRSFSLEYRSASRWGIAPPFRTFCIRASQGGCWRRGVVHQGLTTRLERQGGHIGSENARGRAAGFISPRCVVA